MREPDDPLHADDALVGSGHEDVLSGTAAVGDAEPDVPYADPAPSDADEVLTSVAPMDDQPTMEMPAVVVAAPEPEPRGRFGMVAPWVVFAAVAVVVLAATSTLASVLQGPRSERQSFTGLLQVPTPTATAPAPAAAPPPTSAPAAEPTPEPEKKPEPAARPTTRPKATRAPAPPPRAGAVSAPTTSAKKKPEQSPPPTGGTGSGPAAAGDTADGAAKDDAAKGGAAKGDSAEDGATASGDDSGDSEDEGD